MIRLGQRDRGQITTALVIVGTVIVVALGVAASKLGQATDQKSLVQNAADASALAAAQQIRADAPGQIREAILRGGGGFGCDLGEGAASDFANRSLANLVQYCYDAERDSVEVGVQSQANSASGVPAVATATASLGLRLGPCSVPPTPTPTPTSTPTTAPPTGPAPPAGPAPPPPSPPTGEVRCGDLVIPIVFDSGTGEITIDLSDSEVRARLAPALTS